MADDNTAWMGVACGVGLCLAKALSLTVNEIWLGFYNTLPRPRINARLGVVVGPLKITTSIGTANNLPHPTPRKQGSAKKPRGKRRK